MLAYHKTTEEEKHAICEWKYDGVYSIYNSIPYEEQVKTRRGFANPKNNYYSFFDGSELIAYINLVEKETEVLLGVSVAPAFCDRGYGQKICKTACGLSRQLYPGKPVCIQVRTWNMRAVRCYEKAGFRIIGEPVTITTPVGEGLFYHMTAD
ncbi:MAG: GNAT family N-acetyltransferase [Clostridia bacterium]|nr:GNAT family N-acetyltransferase [Clostridia bacterium]